MNKLLQVLCGSAAAVLLLSGIPVKADDASDGKDGKVVRGKSLEERIRELEDRLKDVGYTGVKGSGIKLSGYVDTSYLVNLRGNDGSIPHAGAGADAALDTTATFGNARTFDHQLNEFTLHAVKLTLEKDKDDSEFPAGFRVDTIYGADANVLNNRSFAALGFRDEIQNDSDFFLEQAYINLGVPVGNGVDVKIGKMVTLIGYEVIESPANANFSRSFAFGLAPLTQTGATFGYNWTDWLTTTVGIVNGFDNDGGFIGVNGSGNNNTEFSYVYRVDLKSPEWSFGNFNLGVSGLWGNDSVNDVASGATGAGGTSVHDNSTSVSVTDVALTWSKPFGFDPLTLGAEWYLMNNETRVTTGGGAGAAGTVENNSADDMVAALYAKWQVTDWLYFAGRGEYWDADARTAAGRGIYNSASAFAPLAAGGTDSIAVYSGTLTAGFNVWKDTLVRLEYRHDEVAGKENGFINAQSNVNGTAPSIRSGQDTIALNVAYSF